MRDLRIIYMGTPDFAVPSLSKIVESGYNVVAVVTAPDKPAGRGLKIKTSPVKDYAVLHKIPVLQPTNLKAPEFIEELKSYNANLQIVVAFRMLPELVWNMPEIGTFNLHASLLPQYRGAAPINWAIMNGETKSGCTTFFLKHEIDTGQILMQREIDILPNDNAGDLHDKLMDIGSNLVLQTVQLIEHENEYPTDQDTSIKCKHAPKIFRNDCKIDWNNSNKNIYNFIRGLSPYPGAWTELNGKVVKIFGAEPSDNKILPGSYKTDNKSILEIGCGEGSIKINQLQVEGKKRMSIEELLRGYKL